MNVRMSRREYFFNIAQAVSLLGECTRTRVGAIIVARDRIWATGRNGTAPGAKESCLKGDCPRGQYTKEQVPSLTPFSGLYSCIDRHAETNANEQFIEVVGAMTGMPQAWFKEPGWASRIPISDFYPVMYVNHKPCKGCVNYNEYIGLETHAPGEED